MRSLLTALWAGLLVTSLFGAEDKKPPEGWKDYQPKGNSFSCWLPTEEGILRENNKDKSPQKGMTLRFASVTYQLKNGPLYEAGTITVMPYAGDFTKLKATERIDIVRDLIVEGSKGKASDEVEVKQGRVPGREFTVEAGKTFTRHRVYQYVDRFFIMSVSGTKDQVKSKDADTFLDSYKIPDRYTGLGEKDKDKKDK
jgi:hypothetical protein